MKRLRLFILLAVALLSVPLVARAGDRQAAYKAFLEEKAPTVASVRFAATVEFGSGNPRDMSGTALVVVVDESGLLMGSHRSLRLLGSGRGKVDMRTLKVRFHDGDDTEYDAFIAATDSKYNLAFLQIENLGDKKLTPIEFQDLDPVLGDEFLTVERLGKGFDYAPHFVRMRVAAEVYVPRHVYALTGNNSHLGLPLYKVEGGRAVGILIRQRGESGGVRQASGPSLSVFLLPSKKVVPVIGLAKRQAEQAMGDIEEEEPEEEEEEDEDEDEGESSDF